MRTLARSRDKAEILRRLRNVRPDSVRRWGRMTSHQMVCHLSDSFRMAIGRKQVTRRTGPIAPLQRTIFKWIVLFVAVPWPAGILTTPEIDQELGGTMPVDFARDVSDLRTLVDIVTAADRRIDWQPHPIFGRMSDAAWLRWAYLHMDHHFRQFGA